MLRPTLAALLIAACVVTAHAQDFAPPTGAEAVDMQRFCARTEGQARFFPRRALERGRSGVAAIDCALNEEGSLQTCVIIDEAPTGFGFGDAALRIACRFPVSAFETTSANNTPYLDPASNQRRVRRTIRFDIGGSEPTPPHGSITN